MSFPILFCRSFAQARPPPERLRDLVHGAVPLRGHDHAADQGPHPRGRDEGARGVRASKDEFCRLLKKRGLT